MSNNEIVENSDEKQLLDEFKDIRQQVVNQLHKRVIGQQKIIDGLLITMLAQGNCLLEGVPGLAKTLLISTLAEVFDLSFNRIQFTPDLMPSDITGTEIIGKEQTSGDRVFKFIKGPVFANIILADEINRTPPKTQSALLEAMQEHHVTVAGSTYMLSLPFHVFATQNPIEQEGTYPLPEAQLDRFMCKFTIDYPDESEEYNIVKEITDFEYKEVDKILNAEKLLKIQHLVSRVPVADNIIKYAVDLVRKTRPNYEKAPDFIKEYVSWGAGPRASQYLIMTSKARALYYNRYAVSREDIDIMIHHILQHRIIRNFHAEAENIKISELIVRLLEVAE